MVWKMIHILFLNGAIFRGVRCHLLISVPRRWRIRSLVLPRWKSPAPLPRRNLEGWSQGWWSQGCWSPESSKSQASCWRVYDVNALCTTKNRWEIMILCPKTVMPKEYNCSTPCVFPKQFGHSQRMEWDNCTLGNWRGNGKTSFFQ